MTGWLAQVRGRPLPRYGVEQEEPLDLTDQAAAAAQLREMLAAQGVPEGELAHAAAELLRDLKDAPAPGESSPVGRSLVAPELAPLESAWHKVLPDPKPFSTHLQPLEPVAAFGESQVRWLAFLREHPQAFDSVDILDDLATAIEGDMEEGAGWIDERVIEPIVARGAAIVLGATSRDERCELPWLDTRNRPALRLVVRVIYLLQRQGRDAEALEWIKRMLAWNPGDNHGMRSLLALAFARAAQHENLLQLAQRYPGDFSLELAYGKCLALYSLDRREEAAAALAEAIVRNRHVPGMLARERVSPPAGESFGIALGGKEQAFLYWEAARELWCAQPGALAWLKKQPASRG